MEQLTEKCRISSTGDESIPTDTTKKTVEDVMIDNGDDKSVEGVMNDDCRILDSSELMDLFREYKRFDSELITVGESEW